jgi:hypothetical protein
VRLAHVHLPWLSHARCEQVLTKDLQKIRQERNSSLVSPVVPPCSCVGVPYFLGDPDVRSVFHQRGRTESGVYTLNGNTLTTITRDLSNPNQVFLATWDEFNKAAFHQPASQGGDTDSFWKYATRRNTVPVVATATATGNIANPSATTVNYSSGADWNGQDGNVTTVGSAGNSSFYGAFDMNGNVREWLEETAFSQGFRGQMGGEFASITSPGRGTEPDFIVYQVPTTEQSFIGFRLASPVGCIADVDDGTGTGTRDGGVGVEDLLYYLSLFEQGSLSADVDNGTGTGVPDGGVGIEDLLYYLIRFGSGC